MVAVRTSMPEANSAGMDCSVGAKVASKPIRPPWACTWAWASAIAEQQATFGELASAAPGGHIPFLEQGVNQLVWDPNGRAAGTPFWKELTAVAATVTTLAANWQPGAAGDQRYAFQRGAWALLASRLHDARESL